MADIVALQTAASRYGDAAGFGSVTADGVMGPQTQQAVTGALNWIATNVPDEADNASNLSGQLTSQQAIVNSADGITTYLNNVADTVGNMGPNIDIPSVGSTTSHLLSKLPGRLPQQAASALDAVAKIPTWVKVGGIFALAAVVWYAWHRVRAHRRGMQGMFGWQGFAD